MTNVVHLVQRRGAGSHFTREERIALEVARLFLNREDDPNKVVFIKSDEDEEVAVFLDAQGDACFSVSKSVCEFVGLDGEGRMVARGPQIRQVLVKVCTGVDMSPEFFRSKLKRVR